MEGRRIQKTSARRSYTAGGKKKKQLHQPLSTRPFTRAPDLLLLVLRQGSRSVPDLLGGDQVAAGARSTAAVGVLL